MRCPKCGKPGADRYEGEQAHKLNTAFCSVCGRVPVAAPEPAPEATPAGEPEPEAPATEEGAAEAPEPDDQEESSLASSRGRQRR